MRCLSLCFPSNSQQLRAIQPIFTALSRAFNPYNMTLTQKKTEKVVIIGAGIFGMSTALWMLKDGGYEVTILDKADVLPALDAASTDINKIIRGGDYADFASAELSRDAITMWRKPEWEGTYHECGLVIVSDDKDAAGHDYCTKSQVNALALDVPATPINKPQDIIDAFPEHLRAEKIGKFASKKGYRNPHGGWAEAGRATDVGLKRVAKMGGKVLPSQEAVALIKEKTSTGEVTVKGVKTKAGDTFEADIVVVAAGAWTPALFALPEVGGSQPPQIVATGQNVAMIQLTPEEVEEYKDVPLVFNLDTGFYSFPPNPDGIIKLALHAAGYVNPVKVHSDMEDVSVPKTKLTPGFEDGFIPEEIVPVLRKLFREQYPKLGEKPFVQSRMCWYCDTPSGDWLIDYHPDYTNVVMATGGSGHAFKFAPIIGREIVKLIQGKLSPEFSAKWSFLGQGGKDADVRHGQRKVLKSEELCTPAHLANTTCDLDLCEKLDNLKVQETSVSA